MLLLGLLLAPPAHAAPFSDQVQALHTSSSADKAAAVKALGATGHPRAQKVLQAMLDGRLFHQVDGGTVVFAEKGGDGYQYRLTDAATGSDLGTAERWGVRRVKINNRLRSEVRQTLAALRLQNPEPEARLTAAEDLIGELDPDNTALVERRLTEESDPAVRAALEAAVGLARLDREDPQARAGAIALLDGSLYAPVRSRLETLAEEDPAPEVRKEAAAMLDGIHTRLAFFDGAETLFFGLSLGSVLMLAAMGLAITFGVMGVINMAHGELIMIGAYTTYVVQQLMPGHIGWSLAVAIPAAFLVSGAFGVAMERSVIRFLYGRPLETLLATFGISLILQQLVRSVFTALNRPVETPAWMSGSLQINPAFSLTFNRLYILIFALAVFFALLLVLKRTSLGLKIRAVTQNRQMARALGVRSNWVDALTFGLGSGIAGVAGVALSQLTNVGPNLGQAYIVDSFLVVVLGGVGNLWGTLVGGLSLGVINKLLEPMAGAVLAKVLLLGLIILFIQRRPRGLFPQRGRAAEG
ncbi:hypothetical protein AN478_07190 [Thiohalorhabdus denitrificans]|nr:hypothetical protein AN478_07190 [Thiohalorhabdus denitrificans]